MRFYLFLSGRWCIASVPSLSWANPVVTYLFCCFQALDLRIREDLEKGVYVQGLKEQIVMDPEQVGSQNRVVVRMEY